MFDFFKNSRIVKVIMVLIAASFVYFGFSGLNFSKSQYIVQVGETRISNYDIKSYLQRNRLPQDEENIRKAYEFLVKRAYYIEGGKSIGIDISPAQISATIQAEPVFLDMSGNFNKEAYNNFIAQTYRSELLFEDELKKNIIYNFVNFYLNNNNVLSDYQLLQYLAQRAVQKEIQSYPFSLESFKDKVTYQDSDLERFYAEHKDAYKQNQAIKFEYILLNPELLLTTETVSKAEMERYFAANKESKPKRMVAHIVLAFPTNKAMDGYTKAAIKKQAEHILRLAQKNPRDFANLAQKFSQDASTAPIGGSLGLIEKNGQYYGSIEDAAFSTRPGEIYPRLVETQDGYHIIKVDAALNWESRAADEPGIAYILKYNKAKNDLATLQEKLSASVFNHPQDLVAASKEVLGANWVKIEDKWFTKEDAQLAGFAPDLINYLFDPLNIRDRAGSEVFALGNNYWVVRVIASKPERIPPFSEIKETVASDYGKLKERELAVLAARAALQKLSQGETLPLAWQGPKTLTLEAAKDYFSAENYRLFLSAEPSAERPVYFLVENSPAPVIVRVNSVKFLDFRNDQDKIRTAFTAANAMQLKKEDVAFLAYLQRSIKLKKGTVNLEY